MKKIEKALEGLILEEIRSQHKVELVPELVRTLLAIKDAELDKKIIVAKKENSPAFGGKQD